MHRALCAGAVEGRGAVRRRRSGRPPCPWPRRLGPAGPTPRQTTIARRPATRRGTAGAASQHHSSAARRVSLARTTSKSGLAQLSWLQTTAITHVVLMLLPLHINETNESLTGCLPQRKPLEQPEKIKSVNRTLVMNLRTEAFILVGVVTVVMGYTTILIRMWPIQFLQG